MKEGDEEESWTWKAFNRVVLHLHGTVECTKAWPKSDWLAALCYIHTLCRNSFSRTSLCIREEHLRGGKEFNRKYILLRVCVCMCACGKSLAGTMAQQDEDINNKKLSKLTPEKAIVNNKLFYVIANNHICLTRSFSSALRYCGWYIVSFSVWQNIGPTATLPRTQPYS